VFVGFLCLPLFCQLQRLGHPSQPNEPIQVHDRGLLVQSYRVLTSLTVELEGLAALSGGLLRSLIENLCCIFSAGLREGL